MAAKLPIREKSFIAALGMAPRTYESATLDPNRLPALIERHSIANLFEAWAEDPEQVRSRGPQVVVHRLLSRWSHGETDNSDAGFENMKAAGFKIGERDAMKTADDAYISAHPLTTGRLLKGPSVNIGSLAFKDLAGKPLIVPQISEGRFTGETFETSEVVTSLDKQLTAAMDGYPGYCEILDLRNADGAPFFAYAYKNLMPYLPRLLVQSYPYVFRSFDEVRAEVDLPLGWQKNFNAGVAVTAETLVAMALMDSARDDGSGATVSVAALEETCRNYIDGWSAQTWRTFAVNLGISAAGEWLHEDEQGATHPNGHAFTDPGDLLTIRAIKAINNVCARLRVEKPKILRIAMARTCDYNESTTGKPFFLSMKTGEPVAWPEEGTAKRYLFDASADLRFMMGHAEAVMLDNPMTFFEIVDQKA